MSIRKGRKKMAIRRDRWASIYWNRGYGYRGWSRGGSILSSAQIFTLKQAELFSILLKKLTEEALVLFTGKLALFPTIDSFCGATQLRG